VASYTDRYPVQNQVSRAIIRALKEAGVVLPYQKGSLDVQIDPDQPIGQRNLNSPLSPGSTHPKEKLP
jgi:small-conductance mechanosensitive channel